MSAIGETLRRERVRQGLDLKAISQITKIGARMLQGIETGDYSRLPGGVFTRNFIRQYALALGLDPASFESELNEFRPNLEDSPRLSQPSFLPNESSSSGSFFSMAAWVLLAGIVCGGVYYLLRPREVKTPIPEVAHSEQAAAPANTAVPEPVKVVGAPSGARGTVQVVLSASEASWVSISVDGKVEFTGILQPNERREFNAEEKVKVVAGNAGGIDISLNGKNIETLGPKGQTRTVNLTRDGAQVVSRVPKAEPLF